MEGEAGREAAACGLYMWVLKPRGSEETLDLLGGLLGRDKWALLNLNGTFFLKLNRPVLIRKASTKYLVYQRRPFSFLHTLI